MFPHAYQFSLVLCRSSCVSVWIEEHLGIAVDRQKGLEIAVRFHKVHNGLDLGLWMNAGTMVSLRAWVAAGTSPCRWKKITYHWVVQYKYIRTQYPKQSYISPPKPISQFLLGSTPTQLEPGFGFLVLRHMRSLTNQPNNWITQERGQILLKLRLAFNVKSSRHQTHIAVGVCETIRIGDDLHEDIIVVKDVGEDGGHVRNRSRSMQ